jgi:hypothetical protein
VGKHCHRGTGSSDRNYNLESPGVRNTFLWLAA